MRTCYGQHSPVNRVPETQPKSEIGKFARRDRSASPTGDLAGRRSPATASAGQKLLGKNSGIFRNQPNLFALRPERNDFHRMGWRRAKMPPIRSLGRGRLLHCAPGRIGFFHLGANGVEIVGRGNYREQQHQEGAQQNNGAETTVAPRPSRGNRLVPPNQSSRQNQGQPKKVEE